MTCKIDDKTVKKQNKKDDQTFIDAGLAGAAAEVIQRYGSANKEIFVGYGGVDNETGKVYSKCLKTIADSKINPDYKDNNIHQQGGFAAEVQSTSRKNAENIVNKKNLGILGLMI
jgi:hypothetical protein